MENRFIGMFSNKQQVEKNILMGIIFLFPVLAVTVNHAATGLYDLVGVLSLIFCVGGYKELSSKEKLFLAGFVLYFLANALSLVNTENMQGGVSRLGRYLLFLLAIPAYLYFKKYREYTEKSLYAGLIFAAYVLCVVAVYQVFVSGELRAHGIMHPIFFGDVCAVVLVLLAAHLILEQHNRAYGFVLGVAVIAVLSALVLSETRGAMLVMPVVFLIGVILFRQVITVKGRLLLVLGVFLVLLMAFYEGSPIRSGFEAGLSDIKLSLNDPNYFGSWSARITMWINSYHLWLSHPVLGIGLGDFGREMKAYVDVAQPGIDPVHYSYTAHNAYVHTMLETGLVGIAAFLMGVFVFPLRSISNNIISYGKNKSSLYRVSLIMVIVSFIIFGISTTWIATRGQIAVFLFFTLIFMSYIHASNKSEC